VPGIEDVIGEVTGSIYPGANADRHAFAGLKGVVKEIGNPFATTEQSKKLEVSGVSREDAIKAFEGTDAARARFEQALTRIDEASVRKIEAARRAESVNADRLAIPSHSGLKVRSVKPEDDHIESIEEFSDGRKVITEKTAYPMLLTKITEEPDGTRIIDWTRSNSGDGSLSLDSEHSYVDSQTIEHADGRKAIRYVKNVDNEH
jgi:hypothetical protein